MNECDVLTAAEPATQARTRSGPLVETKPATQAPSGSGLLTTTEPATQARTRSGLVVEAGSGGLAVLVRAGSEATR